MKTRVMFLVTVIRVMVVLTIGLVVSSRRVMCAERVASTESSQQTKVQFEQLAQIIETEGPEKLTAALAGLKPVKDDNVLLYSGKQRCENLLHRAVATKNPANLWVFLDFMGTKKEILLHLFEMQDKSGMRPAVIAWRGGEPYIAVAWVLGFFIIKYELMKNENFKSYWLVMKDVCGWIEQTQTSSASILLDLVNANPQKFLKQSLQYVLTDQRIPDFVKAEFAEMTTKYAS